MSKKSQGWCNCAAKVMESHCPTQAILDTHDVSLRSSRLPHRALLCPASLSTALAGNPRLQAPAPCPHTVLFPLLLTALPELGKQDFILLLSLEQKCTSDRERNLNHNLEIQRDSGLAWQGSLRSLTAKWNPTLRSESGSLKTHPIPFVLSLGSQPNMCSPSSTAFQQFNSFLFQLALYTQVFHFRINVPSSKGFPKAYMAIEVVNPSLSNRQEPPQHH